MAVYIDHPVWNHYWKKYLFQKFSGTSEYLTALNNSINRYFYDNNSLMSLEFSTFYLSASFLPLSRIQNIKDLQHFLLTIGESKV